MFKRPSLQRAAVALWLSGAALSAHAAATLVGDTLDFKRAYPNVDTPYGSSIPSTTVAPGTSDVVVWSNQVSINPEADRILFTVLSATNFVSTSSVFDGFIVSGFDNDIASVSLLSNATGFGVSLAHQLRSFTLNLSTAPTFSSGEIAVAVTLVNVPVTNVPEPSTWVLAASAMAALGAVRRRCGTN